MVVVDSRTFVKDSARLSLRGVHGVATGVDFKWPVLLQAGAGAELRLKEREGWLFMRKNHQWPSLLQGVQKKLGVGEDTPCCALWCLCSSLFKGRGGLLLCFKLTGSCTWSLAYPRAVCLLCTWRRRL